MSCTEEAQQCLDNVTGELLRSLLILEQCFCKHPAPITPAQRLQGPLSLILHTDLTQRWAAPRAPHEDRVSQQGPGGFSQHRVSRHASRLPICHSQLHTPVAPA